MKKIIIFLFLLSSLASAQVTRNYGVTAPALLTKYGITYGLNGRFTLGSTGANTSTTKKYLTETGTGTLGQAPVFSTLDIAALATSSNGILLSGISNSEGIGINIGISANGINLDRIQVASANSKLLGSGASGIGLSYGEITLGTGLSMTGTTLNASSASGANPSASVGLTAVNGSASTFLRSDGAPALSQSIAPTWTALHTFSYAVQINASVGYALSVFGASASSIIGFFDNSSNLLFQIPSSGSILMGDVANVSATTAAASITQRNNSEIGLIIKQYSAGAALQQWRTSGDAVFSEMTSTGLSLGGATPGARLDIRQGTLGLNLITLNNQGSVVHNVLQNAVTTVGNVAGIVHIYQTTTGSVLFIKNWIIGRVTVGAGVVGNGVVIEFLAAYRNVGGVVTQIGADTKTVLTDDAAYTAASNINGTTVELKVTGKIGHNLTWDVIQLNGAY